VRKNMPKNFLSGHRKWNTLAFRGRLMSLLVLTHSGVSPRPHLPQESRIFHLLGQFIPRIHNIQCAAQLIGMEGGDSSGNSTSLKTPQSGFLEEAEAVPAESVRLQWKSTVCCTQPDWSAINHIIRVGEIIKLCCTSALFFHS